MKEELKQYGIHITDRCLLPHLEAKAREMGYVDDVEWNKRKRYRATTMDLNVNGTYTLYATYIKPWEPAMSQEEFLNLNTMKELKIRTYGNENYSKAVQDLLFKLGYKWQAFDKGKHMFTKEPILYVGDFIYNATYDWYDDLDYSTFEDLFKMVEEKENADKVVEMTMEEICEALGKIVKITKGGES